MTLPISSVPPSPTAPRGSIGTRPGKPVLVSDGKVESEMSAPGVAKQVGLADPGDGQLADHGREPYLPLPVAAPQWRTRKIDHVVTRSVHPGRVLAALSDPVRLRVLAAVVSAPRPEAAAELSDATGLPRKEVDRALRSLEAAGVIQVAAPAAGPQDQRWEAVPETFADATRQVARMRPPVDPEALGATPEQIPVLRGFLADDRLSGIPAQQSKRAVVLDFVAQQFEPGRRYSEPEVNRTLHRLWDDHATLRRILVDEGLLDREGGRYWRAGGTFDVDRDRT